MANVNVTGLPSNVTFLKLVTFLKQFTKRRNFKRNFWIKELSCEYGSDTKQMIVELDSPHDAYTFKDILDYYRFRDGVEMYPLRVEVLRDRSCDDRRPPPRRNRNRGYTDTSFHSRSRSRSPLYNESSKLDMEIQLLRKQTLVIEAERRLLLERKKLELIKEFGSSALNEYRDFEPRERSRSYERRFDNPRPRRRTRRPSPTLKKAPRVSIPRLPGFVLPCKVIIEQMEPLIKEDLSEPESVIIVKLIRSTIRRRIAVALEQKEYMNTVEIVKLYRELYPPRTDECLLKALVEKLRGSHLPHLMNYKKETQSRIEETTVTETNTDENNESQSTDSKVIKDEPKTIKEDEELQNECAVSLDAPEIDLSINNAEDKDWIVGDGGDTDWMGELNDDPSKDVEVDKED